MGITRHPIIIFLAYFTHNMKLLSHFLICCNDWCVFLLTFRLSNMARRWLKPATDRVCYQSSITWGKAGNYLQSVSSNTVMICDKPVKITNVLLFAEIEIHRKQKWSFNYYICTTSWQPAELQTNGNSVCMSTVTAVSPSQTESLCICFPACNILTVF